MPGPRLRGMQLSGGSPSRRRTGAVPVVRRGRLAHGTLDHTTRQPERVRDRRWNAPED